MNFENLVRPVSGSADLERIKALPRRVVNPKAYVEPVTQALRNEREIDPSLPHKLNPTQAWALYEISRAQGLLGPIGVGHGKTGLDILAPLVIPRCRTVVLLLPAALRDAIAIEHRRWQRNFRVPNLFGSGNYYDGLPTIYPVSYDQLSRESAARLLETLKPDTIIADEVHCLRYKNSTRSRRLLRYFADHKDVRFMGWSGTLTAKSIKDYAHLSALALKNGSPLPLHTGTLEEWAGALDANPRGLPVPPGALSQLCVNGDSVREGFRKRFVETLGVVATEEASVECSIYFLERKIEVPDVIGKALGELRATACRPDGEEFVEASQVYRCGRELASGFYYRWRFPRGEDRKTIDRWLDVRRNWHKELREELKRNRPLMDSPLMCCRAAHRALDDYEGELPVWRPEFYEEWLSVKPTVRPETEPVWLSDYLLEDITDDQEKKIIWYEHDTFGRRLADKQLLVFGAGVPGHIVESEKGTYAASLLSHGTGRNLQIHHSSNLIANYPTALAAWEQLIGRTHRQGQAADEVIVSVYRHTPELREAFKRAREYARYQSDTMGVPMKLLTASYTFNPDEA
jgi:hypothetical protein